MTPRSAARTDVGKVREANEDSYIERSPLFGVADGMGGHIAGDVASSTAVETILEQTKSADPEGTGALVSLVENANSAILAKGRDDSTLRGMGTTCTLLLIREGRAHIAHVGDSRGYVYRDGALRQLTEDHTLVNRMVREGRITAEEAEHHPQRSIVTRALGVDDSVQVDTETMDIAEGDRFLLCSDGLTGMVGGDTIAQVLGEESDPGAAAERLIELANASGGEDNITVVIVDIAGSDTGGSSGAMGTTRASTDPGGPPPPPPPADDARPMAEPVAATGGSRRARRVIIAVVLIVLVAGGGYAAARYALSRSFYVGVTEDGNVAIYRGIPDEVAGLSLNEVEQETAIAFDDLPESFQETVQEGIKVDSLEEAEATVEDLEARVQDFQDTSGTQREKSP